MIKMSLPRRLGKLRLSPTLTRLPTPRLFPTPMNFCPSGVPGVEGKGPRETWCFLFFGSIELTDTEEFEPTSGSEGEKSESSQGSTVLSLNIFNKVLSGPSI